MLKSKKGISPILATLLLIVIAVAAIIVTYAWVMTYMGTQTQQAGTMLDHENVSWYSNRTAIVVKNTGTADAKIVKLYMGISQSNYTNVTANSNIGTGIVVPAGTGNFKDVIVNWPNGFATSWISGQRYWFKVAPEVGATHEFSWAAP